MLDYIRALVRSQNNSLKIFRYPYVFNTKNSALNTKGQEV